MWETLAVFVSICGRGSLVRVVSIGIDGSLSNIVSVAGLGSLSEYVSISANDSGVSLRKVVTESSKNLEKMIAPADGEKLRKERIKEIARTLYMPPEVYENLTQVAIRIGVPIEIVAEAAFWSFAKLEPLEQRQMVLAFHYDGPIAERGLPHGSAARRLVRFGISSLHKFYIYLCTYFRSRRPPQS